MTLLGLDPEVKVGELTKKFQVDTKKLQDDNILDYKVSTLLSMMLRPMKSKEDLLLVRDFKVVASTRDSFGKWPNVVSNSAFIDSRFIIKELALYLYDYFEETALANIDYDWTTDFYLYFYDEEVSRKIRQVIKGVDYSRFALQDFVIFKNREELYLDGKGLQTFHYLNDFLQRKPHLSKMYSYQLPIASRVEDMKNLTSMLLNIEYCMIFFFSLLGLLIIQTLLLSDIKERIYEFGIYRVVGMPKSQVSKIVQITTLSFSLPAITIGLTLFAIYMVIPVIALYLASNKLVVVRLGWVPFVLAVVSGLILPLISANISSFTTLTASLRELIDKQRRAVSYFQIQQAKLASYFSPVEFLMGVIMASFCFLTGYFVPYYYSREEMGMFFLCLNVVLMALIMGLSFLGLLLQDSFSFGLLDLLMATLFSGDAKLKTIISKQMVSHCESNKKTALIFMMTTGFLVFAVSNLQSLGQLVVSGAMVHIGSSLGLVPANLGFFKEPPGSPKITNLDEKGLNLYLDEEKKLGNLVDFSYVFAMLDSSMLNADGTHNGKMVFELGSADSGTAAEVRVYGVQENFLAATYGEFYNAPIQTEECKERGLLQVIYAEQYKSQNMIDEKIDGKRIWAKDEDQERVEDQRFEEPLINIGASTLLYKELGLEPGTTTELCIKQDVSQPCQVSFRVKIHGYIQKLPGIFEFSDLEYRTFISPTGSTKDRQPDPAILITEQQLRFMINKYRGTPSDLSYTIPKNRVLVRAHESASEQTLLRLRNRMLNFAGDLNIFAFNTPSFVEKLSSSLKLIDVFSMIIQLFAFTLCFFQVIVSVNTNMQETGWELGVLRAAGITKSEMRKISLIESFVVITSALLIGLGIGMFAAASSVELYDMVLEIPMQPTFPLVQVLLLVLFAYTSLFFGALLKLQQIGKLSISSLLKEGS